MSSKTVTILFGEMGAGKNYHGERLASGADMPFLDGDDVLTPEMKERVAHFRPVTPAMIDRYVEGSLYDAIVSRTGERGIVVAQALYLNRHRVMLSNKLTVAGFNVEFMWIRAPFWRNLRQILTRPHGWKWAAFWLFNKLFFQRPCFACASLS